VILIVLRKMISNKWMVICLLLGSILTVSILSSIPIYTSGVLQRMLLKDLENIQKTTGVYPGGSQVTLDLSYGTDLDYKAKRYDYNSKIISENFSKDLILPVKAQSEELTGSNMLIKPDTVNVKEVKGKNAVFTSLPGLLDHVKITQGKMFSKDMADGAYEAVITENALNELDLYVGEVYNIYTNKLTGKDRLLFKVKIVGIIKEKDSSDLFWGNGFNAYKDNLFIDYDVFEKEIGFKDNDTFTAKVNWFFALDYTKMNLNNISQIIDNYNKYKKFYDKQGLSSFKMESIFVLEQYSARQKQLKTTLWVLQIPILLMLAFYIFMVSKLTVEYESNEIAVLKSRGAGSLQVFLGYLMQSLIIGFVAIITGPVLGLLLCKLLGASNGFLQFVQRTALPVSLSPQTYIYSFAAVLFFIITMMIPVFIASKTSIVLYKQKQSTQKSRTFWERYFLDVILLGIAIYGLFSYSRQQKLLIVSGLKGSEMIIDPLLFIISTMFILGCGLVFLRIFPYLVKLIYRLGRKIWSPVLYASFIQVGRTVAQVQFLIIFIIITLSIGIFNSNSARTINSNMEEQIRYDIGADVVIKGHWTDNQVVLPTTVSGPPSAETSVHQDEFAYNEPPFEPYAKLSGVYAATKVLQRDDITVQLGDNCLYSVTLQGIIPNEFGKVAWFRPSLLPTHWYNYLNLMTKAQGAVLVSKSFKEKNGLKIGDSINLSWAGQKNIEGVIYGFVDYWPALNPNKINTGNKYPYFVVANLDYIQAMLSVEPYQVWLKKKPGATSNQITLDIQNKKIQIEDKKDAVEQITKKKNDALLEGTNGSLTLGFIVTIIICIVGFLIYWLMSIRKRVLQFGIFRAMGLSRSKIIGMIACEQLMISGTSILAGIIIGNYTSKIFVPLLQMMNSAEDQVPPFKVVSLAGDYIRLYSILGIMLVLGFIVLGAIINKINISQALKLGED
jgi:putative ABC transport system permease protein